MTKYKEYVKRMIDLNKAAFAEFESIHDKYVLDSQSNQSEFNRTGDKILAIIREWEQKLCLQSEKGGYGKFTSNLSEKFWEEIRKTFPLIDQVGVTRQKQNIFKIKKISLAG